MATASVALAEGQPDRAAKLVAEAQDFAAERAMRHIYPLIGLAQGQVQAALGQPALALAAYEQVDAQAAAMGMRPFLWQAKAGAAAALDALGRPAQAESKRESARLMIDEIAGMFESDEMRAAYSTAALAALAKG